MDNYKKIKKLGQGTYGIVWKAQNTITGNIVALKQIQLNSMDEGVPCTAIREISLLKELQHPNIVRLIEIIQDEDLNILIIFECCDFDLKQYMDIRGEGLLMLEIKNFLSQLLNAVAFCHGRKVLHRDLKTQNLLINKDGSLKLCDFGLARESLPSFHNYSHEVVTLWYRAPEILMGLKNYTNRIDMWSIGCIMAEMKNYKPLFPGKNPAHQLYTILKKLGTPTLEMYPNMVNLPEYQFGLPDYPLVPVGELVPNLPSDALELLESFLQYDPKKRLSAQEALQHSFFNTLNDNEN